MKTLLVNLLSILVHHANRNTKETEFYAIKKRLLLNYGEFICNEIQVIEAKECYTCNASGWYQYQSMCRNCAGTGFYRDTIFNLLAKYKLGGYYFHVPLQRMRYNDTTLPILKGYITHSYSKYGNISKKLLYFMFDTKYFLHTFSFHPKIIQRIKWQWHLYKLRRRNGIVLQVTNSEQDLPF